VHGPVEEEDVSQRLLALEVGLEDCSMWGRMRNLSNILWVTDANFFQSESDLPFSNMNAKKASIAALFSE
jgi:hypothetical protein